LPGIGQELETNPIADLTGYPTGGSIGLVVREMEGIVGAMRIADSAHQL
jgi:hypothetical protein